jgi:conjugative transfer signal peptidase TraF
MTGRRLLFVCTSALTLIAAGSMPGSPHYMYNLTPSVPRGLYRLKPPGQIEITTLVAAMPPEPLATALDLNGYLPLGVPLLKRVLALSGQRVCRLGTAISVDALVLTARARERDARGRPLPSWRGCHRVAEDEVFLMNWDSDDSLDGRYFGVLPRSAIIARAIPIWTDEAGDGRFVWHAPTQ